jgi:hypothetical protein
MLRYATTIRWGSVNPEWEETFEFNVPCSRLDGSSSRASMGSSMGSSGGAAKNTADDEITVSDDSLRIIVRDAVKSESAANERSSVLSVIGECFLNFSELLDQKSHSLWLPIVDTGTFSTIT